jgi:TolA-binding protein
MFLFACASASESAVVPEQPGLEDPAPEAAETVEADDPPVASLFPEAAGEDYNLPIDEAVREEEPVPDELIEPLIDLAEVVTETAPPPEQGFDTGLPEPLAPVFPEPPALVEIPAPQEPVLPPPAAPPVTPPVIPPAAPPAAAPAVPPAVRPIPPAPPPFLRPAEEELPPPVRVSEPSLPEPPARTPPVETQEPGIVFSRVVRATVGQLVEVPFQGTGWVYLGELGSRPGIVYSSRRLDPDGQSFVFRAEAAGTYGLKFYKQDFVRDYILNDHVQVIVGDPPEAAALGWFNPAVDRGRVVAEPRWPTAQEEADAFSRSRGAVAVVPGTAGPPADAPGTPAGSPGTSGPVSSPSDLAVETVAPSGVLAETAAAAEPVAGQAGVAPVVGTAPAVRETPSDEGVVPVRPAAVAGAPSTEPGTPPGALGNLQPSGYLERARQEFDAGRVATAISVLDQFRERYPSGSDEAWWLYGQFYEANSPSRDIRMSLDYYRRLVREYPQSSRYNDARRRIAYLERYYINIQ